jgi:hypothetical protein
VSKRLDGLHNYRLCACAWPVCSRFDVNRCAYCTKEIPVRREDMTVVQHETKLKYEQMKVAWPKESE